MTPASASRQAMHLPAMLRPPATLCVALRAGIALQAGARPTTLEKPASIFRRGGFTLVEILAALFLLFVVVTISAQMLRETRRGAARAAEGEAASYAAANALDVLRRDLVRAVGGGTFTFMTGQDPALTSVNSHELRFVALTDSMETNRRAASCIYYWIETGGVHACGYNFAADGAAVCGDLVRAEIPIFADAPQSPYTHSYSNWCLAARPSTTDVVETVVRHVTGFNVLSTSNDWTVADNWCSPDLPICLDVYLEVLPEPAARRIEARRDQMADVTNETVAALEAAVVRKSMRVFLPNRRGCHAR